MWWYQAKGHKCCKMTNIAKSQYLHIQYIQLCLPHHNKVYNTKSMIWNATYKIILYLTNKINLIPSMFVEHSSLHSIQVQVPWGFMWTGTQIHLIFVFFCMKTLHSRSYEKTSFWLKRHQQRWNIQQASQYFLSGTFSSIMGTLLCELRVPIHQSLHQQIVNIRRRRHSDPVCTQRRWKMYLFLCLTVDCGILQYLWPVANILLGHTLSSKDHLFILVSLISALQSINIYIALFWGAWTWINPASWVTCTIKSPSLSINNHQGITSPLHLRRP
jgi:hypothetical protein